MIKYIVARHNLDSSEIIKKYLNSNKIKTNGRILEIWNDDQSIFEKYNTGINTCKLQDNDVLCFMHEDIIIKDDELEEKVNYIFNSRKELGVLGVIGTEIFEDNGGWWHSNRNNHVGHIEQSKSPTGCWHMIKKQVTYQENIVAVDGCIFFVRGSLAKELKFDNNTFNGYHFYDADYCFSALEKGYKIGIADILVEHLSSGPIGVDWENAKDAFFKKWKNKNITFPVNCRSFNV